MTLQMRGIALSFSMKPCVPWFLVIISVITLPHVSLAFQCVIPVPSSLQPSSTLRLHHVGQCMRSINSRVIISTFAVETKKWSGKDERLPIYDTSDNGIVKSSVNISGRSWRSEPLGKLFRVAFTIIISIVGLSSYEAPSSKEYLVPFHPYIMSIQSCSKLQNVCQAFLPAPVYAEDMMQSPGDITLAGVDLYKLRDELNSPDVMTRRKARSIVDSRPDPYSKVAPEATRDVDPYDIIGVGTTLIQTEQGGQVIIASPPRPGSPANLAGLKYGDKVLGVNGVPTQGRNVFGIVDQILENMDKTTITMTIEDADSTLRRNIEMNRDFANVPTSVEYKISERRPDGTVVGYIQLSRFNAITTTKMKEAILSLKKQGVNAFVIDVRDNGGGSLQSALWTVKLFLGNNKVILNAVEGSRVTPYRANKSTVLIDASTPVVVLINRGSASATEIFTSALRDNCRALVIGERSYGKGLIQAVVGLKNGSHLVLTTGKYLTPNGREIQGKGIHPDITGRSIVKGTDTSKIDFKQVSAKLSSLCSLPKNNAR